MSCFEGLALRTGLTATGQFRHLGLAVMADYYGQDERKPNAPQI